MTEPLFPARQARLVSPLLLLVSGPAAAHFGHLGWAFDTALPHPGPAALLVSGAALVALAPVLLTRLRKTRTPR